VGSAGGSAIIAPRVTEIEWWYDDVTAPEEVAARDVEGLELESAAGPGLEDEIAHDEIARASEELQSDAG
jgi:hypothetical protein